MHPFAWWLARRTSAALVVCSALTSGIVVLTDEPANTMAMRLARIAALGPLLAGVSVLAVAGHARARGELVALEALGQKPWRAALGAAVAGWSFGALSLAVLMSPWADAQSLFPRLVPSIDWVIDASGSVARAGGASLFADGTIEMTSPSTVRTPAGGTAFSAFLVLSPIALATPLWAVTPMSRSLRLASLFAATAGLVLALHLTAAGRVHGAFGALASVPLFAAVLRASRTRNSSSRATRRIAPMAARRTVRRT